jgi:fructose-specific phosphotransferase system IIA component
MYYLNEHNIYIFLLQIFLLLALARGLGELFRLFKQPPLTAEILVGILLGPTILGRFAPEIHHYIFPPDAMQQAMLETVGWIGVLFLLLHTGLEIDLVSAWRQRTEAFKIAVYGVVIPLFASFLCIYFLAPDRILAHTCPRLFFGFFMATAMSITAVPVTARALHDLRLSKTDLGYLIMSALSLNDILGWIVFAVILAVIMQVGATLSAIGVTILIIIVFTVAALTIGQFLAAAAIKRFKYLNMPEPGTPLTFICILGLLGGAITARIGIQALYGFLIAGIMAGQSPALSERTRQIFAQMVNAIFVPLFFAGISLKLDFFKDFDIGIVLLVTFIGLGARFCGAWLGVYTTGISSTNRLSIAIAHTPGGAMEIVMGMLALQHGLITEKVFVAITCGGVFSAMLLGPWLGYSISKRKKISVLEFFLRDALIANLRETNRDDALHKLSETAAEQEHIAQPDLLYQAVLNRETAAGTAMEEGVAVPHARTELVRRPSVVFGRSAGGIEWNSPDGKPAQFIFLILTPKTDDEAQVQILGHIARAMSKPETRHEILAAPDVQTIWNILHKVLAPEQIKRK